MLLFKNTKEKKSDQVSASDKIARTIAGGGIRLQTKFATTLNRLFINVSAKKLKGLLLVFCILSGGYSIYLFSVAITSERIDAKIKIERITSPGYFNNEDDGKISSEDVDEHAYTRILAFEKYMHSLKKNKTKIYDSILQVRPGLMDSVQVLKEIYQSQKQK